MRFPSPEVPGPGHSSLLPKKEELYNNEAKSCTTNVNYSVVSENSVW